MTDKQRRKLKKEFGSFASTTIIMFGINLMTSPGRWWFVWVTGIWGATLLGRYVQYSIDDESEVEDNDYLDLDDHPEYAEPSQKWEEKDFV